MTDLSADEARGELRQLEDLRAALVAAAWPGQIIDGVMPVVLIDNDLWGEYASNVSAMVTFSTWRPFILLTPGRRTEEDFVAHEIVHALNGQVGTNLPRWLDEGLATYYESIAFDPRAGTFRVGEMHQEYLPIVQHLGTLSIRDLESAENVRDNAMFFYAGSWLVAHWMMNHAKDAVRCFAIPDPLDRSDARVRDRCWTQLGGREAVESELRVYRTPAGGEFRIFTGSFTPPSYEPESTAMNDSDAHVARALVVSSLATWFDRDDRERHGEFVKRNVEEALAADPANPWALAFRAERLGFPVTRLEATRATERHPQSFLAHQLLADALERERADIALIKEARETAEDFASANPAIRLSGWRSH